MESTSKYTSEDKALADIAKAMGHPARIMILHLLRERGASLCGQVVDQLPLAQSTVSQHLKELRQGGLIVGQTDGPRIYYSINPEIWESAKVLFDDFFQSPSDAKPADPQDVRVAQLNIGRLKINF